MNTKPDNAQPPEPARAPQQTRIIAVVLAVAWLAASFLMYDRFVTPGDANAWDRALVIYNGLSSVGFSAIGVLLGTQVQQVNLAAARRDTAAAKQGEAEAKIDAATIRAGAKAAAKIAAGAADTGGGKPGTDVAEIRLTAVHHQLVDIL